MAAIEFETTATATLESRFDVVTWVAAVSAAALLLLALLFVRAQRQRERLREKQQAQSRLAALGEMSAVMAHEIRNPLASLKGHAQILEELLSGEDSAHAARATLVVGEAERLQHLTTDLLEFARSGELRRDDLDPVQLVRQAAAEIGDDSVDVRAEGAPRLWSLDGVRMHRVLTNVLDNAVQASSEGSRPVATVSQIDGSLQITVRDSGSGIPPGQEELIFEPFHTGKERGVGLGLAVARWIVEQHHGSISASNHADGGALFTIRLPAA
jgi:two-component system sensor histidine kinase HydH